MRQTNVIRFPAQPTEDDRLRLYRDEQATVVVLSTVRTDRRAPKSMM